MLLKNDGVLPLSAGHEDRGDRSARRRDPRLARQLLVARVGAADLGSRRSSAVMLGPDRLRARRRIDDRRRPVARYRCCRPDDGKPGLLATLLQRSLPDALGKDGNADEGASATPARRPSSPGSGGGSRRPPGGQGRSPCVWSGFLVPPETGSYRLGLSGGRAASMSVRRASRWSNSSMRRGAAFRR